MRNGMAINSGKKKSQRRNNPQAPENKSNIELGLKISQLKVCPWTWNLVTALNIDLPEG